MPGRNLTGQYFLGIHLPDISLLLTCPEVEAVSRAILDLSSDAAEWSFQDHAGPKHMKKIAEGRAFLAIAPHLGPSEFFKRIIGRSGNAVDLDGLELWLAHVSEDEAHKAVEILNAPPDDATLYRVLWMLPHIGIVLSESDHNRLAVLAGSPDPRVRAGAMRVAVVAQDELLGRQIVDSGRSLDTDAGPWEEHWMTLLLAEFGKHLPFDDIARRLRPSTLGFVIAQRGNRDEELRLYAACLDQEWRRIIAAEDPDIDSLPEITLERPLDDAEGRLPRLHEPAKSQTIHLGVSNSWTSGPPVDTENQLRQMFSADYDKQVQQLNEDRRRKVDAILNAWRTEAFQWYGRGFSFETMDALYQQDPARINRWVQPALAESASGLAVRTRIGSFLEPICQVLLNRNPQLGLSIWRVLRNRDSCPIVFDTTDIAFGADTSEAHHAREIILSDCWNDEAISKVALASGRWKRSGWLDQQVQELILAPKMWRRAKGLTLASLSDVTPDAFEALVAKASVGDTWVEGSLRHLRENVRRNNLARHWYRLFLTSEDRDAAWGALEIVRAQADERFLNWHEEIEEECVNAALRQDRLRFLGLVWRTWGGVRKDLNRDKNRRERLFGLAIQPGEIVPFLVP
jgi:hypothetical protein